MDDAVQRLSPRPLLLFALLGGVVALAVGLAGSALLGWIAGTVCLIVSLAVIAWRSQLDEPADPGRRRFLALTGLGGLLWVGAGALVGRTFKQLLRPDPRPVQEAMARDLGAEYMELVRRAYHPDRSGDLQLLLAPFNSSNYPKESLSLVPQDPRTSHASVWMYLERVPLVVYAPGRVVPSDSAERITLADIAPTIARLIGFDGWPTERGGRPISRIAPPAAPPRIVVTFVIDGGGWNVLDHWAGRWPTLRRLMNEGATFRNAIHGSFPAVTACAHATIGTGTYPSEHGITGHNIRDGRVVRKAYGEPGRANPGDILVPTLADLWADATGAWVGEIGYQIWHLGMLGYGGRHRQDGDRPVAVFWHEQAEGGGWQPQNPDLFRMPQGAPGPDVFERHRADFSDPGWDPQFAPQRRQSPCCSPPVVRYQGDLIDATLRNEPIAETGTTGLLFVNFKSPDYTGHVYNMFSRWEGLILEEVDAQLARLVATLEELYPDEYALIVTADHGQCPLPDAVGGVRLDPIQLGEEIERGFGGGPFAVVQNVVPSEVYLHKDVLWDHGATVEDVAAFLKDYRYRQNIGPYVPRSAVEQDLLDRKEFAAVFATSFLETLEASALLAYGETAFPDADGGIPTIR
jgi:arylsulfatase A-like enzyme